MARGNFRTARLENVETAMPGTHNSSLGEGILHLLHAVKPAGTRRTRHKFIDLFGVRPSEGNDWDCPRCCLAQPTSSSLGNQVDVFIWW
jgi:hypothetical protein